MKQFDYSCFKNTTQIKEVKDQLQNLDTELKNTEMHNLIAFNHTYFVITRNVFDKLGKNYFEDDILMNSIDINFGNYYFQALHNYIQKKPCAPAWELLFDSCKRNDTFQFVYMALGVNAHVNNDLPQTLRDVTKDKVFIEDYLRINRIISESLPEVISSLHEKNKTMDAYEKLLEKRYHRFLNYTIKKWRNSACDTYMKLMNQTIEVSQIELYSKKKAEVLISIHSVLDIPRVLLVC